MLTEIQIKNLKPEDKPYKKSDRDGLYVHVHPNGSKYWRLKYRYSGKEKVLAIGQWPEMSLSDARKSVIWAKDVLAEGRDPVIERKLEKLREQAKAMDMVDTIFGDYAAEQDWCEKRRLNIQSSYSRFVQPAIGKLPASSVRPIHLMECLQDAHDNAGPTVAVRLRQILKQAFGRAMRLEITDRNPAEALAGTFKKNKSQSHHAAVSWNYTGHVLVAVDNTNGDALVKLAAKFLAYTVIRTGELRKLKWDFLNLEKGYIDIPPEIMKQGNRHIVPLNAGAKRIIEQLKALKLKSEYMFPSYVATERGTISENSILNKLSAAGFTYIQTGHGFRSCFSSSMNELGYNRDAIERQLAHCETIQVRDAYLQAEFFDERQKIMDRWGDLLDELQAQAKAEGFSKGPMPHKRTLANMTEREKAALVEKAARQFKVSFGAKV